MKRFQITVNGNSYDVQVEEMDASAAPSPKKLPDSVPASPKPAVEPVKAEKAAPTVQTPSTAPAGADELNAPMPGTIVNVMVKVGDQVKKGQVLLVLEAMKMENEIMSPKDAVIAAVHVNKSDSVDSGTLMISLQ
jgi:glutaconyl-CoA decarboxylase